MIEIIDNDLSIIKNDKYVLDFYADWCGPCRVISPILKDLETEEVPVYKINVDTNQKIAEEYNVRSIPLVIFHKDGKPFSSKVGSASRDAYSELFNSIK